MPPPSRTVSWLQLVLEADPEFRQLSNRPMAYIFSEGRVFYDPMPLYGTPYMTDEFGNIMTDEFGNKMRADVPGTQTGTATGFVFGTSIFGKDPF